MVKLMLGVPVGKLSVSSFWVGFTNIVSHSHLPFSVYISNRVDLNRSALINMAIKGGYDLCMFDSDVILGTGMKQVKEILDEDFKEKSIGMVIAPTVGVGGTLLAEAPPQKDSIKWEVNYAGLGFCAIKLEVMQKLPVISQYNALGGEAVPMRVVYATNTSEDIVLVQAIRNLGYKVLVDSRIKAIHIQSSAYSYPESVTNFMGQNK